MALHGPMADWVTTEATPRKSRAAGSRQRGDPISSRSWADHPSVLAARARAPGATASTRADHAPKTPAVSRATAAHRARSPAGTAPKRSTARSTRPAALAHSASASSLASCPGPSSARRPPHSAKASSPGSAEPDHPARNAGRARSRARRPPPNHTGPSPARRRQRHAVADHLVRPALLVTRAHYDTRAS